MFNGLKCSKEYLERFKPLEEFPEEFRQKIEILADKDKIDWMLLHKGKQKVRTKHYNMDDAERYLGSINEHLKE